MATTNTMDPLAIMSAALTQRELIKVHTERLTLIKAERYKIGSREWLNAMQEIASWQQSLDVLDAVLNGHTVMPS